MKPTWVIENYTKDTSSTDLINEVKKQGFDCYVIIPVPVDKKLTDGNELPVDGNCVIFHGTIKTAEKVSIEKPGWMPGSISNFDLYSYASLYGRKTFDYLLNKDHELYSCEELFSNKWSIYRKFGKDAEIWVRPSSSKKPFAGSLIHIEEFDKIYEEDIKQNCLENEIIVVSSPKEINSEFRFICSPYGIVASCCYFYQKNRVYIPSAPTGATELCKELLQLEYKPDYFFAVDICEDKDGKFYLLEYNAFSTSGLYACNKESIVRQVSNYAEWIYGSENYYTRSDNTLAALEKLTS